jgi:hypothetical protein
LKVSFSEQRGGIAPKEISITPEVSKHKINLFTEKYFCGDNSIPMGTGKYINRHYEEIFVKAFPWQSLGLGVSLWRGSGEQRQLVEYETCGDNSDCDCNSGCDQTQKHACMMSESKIHGIDAALIQRAGLGERNGHTLVNIETGIGIGRQNLEMDYSIPGHEGTCSGSILNPIGTTWNISADLSLLLFKNKFFSLSAVGRGDYSRQFTSSTVHYEKSDFYAGLSLGSK